MTVFKGFIFMLSVGEMPSKVHTYLKSLPLAFTDTENKKLVHTAQTVRLEEQEAVTSIMKSAMTSFQLSARN